MSVLKMIPGDIDTPNPFADDRLARSVYARKLMSLIENLTHPFVISLNSPWGTGKTFFIKRFEKMLQGNRFKTIYYNAWENDYSNDALISIMAEIDGALKNWGIQEDNAALKGLKNFVKKAAKNPLELIVATAIHNTPILPEEKINELMESYVSHEIKKYKTIKNGIEGFTANLGSVINEIRNNKPIVFIIDELDRCRPEFAIEVLEKVKHLFNITGIVFIICIDKDQINSSVSSLYGEKYSKEGYLRKFFDFEIKLPESPYKNYVADVCRKYDFQMAIDRGHLGSDTYSRFVSSLAFLFQLCLYPLRSTEQFLCNLVLIYETCKEITEHDLYLLPVMLMLKELDSSLYESFFSGNITHKEILNILMLENPRYKQLTNIYDESYVTHFLPTDLLALDSRMTNDEKRSLLTNSHGQNSIYNTTTWGNVSQYYSNEAQRKLLKQKIDFVVYFQSGQ